MPQNQKQKGIPIPNSDRDPIAKPASQKPELVIDLPFKATPKQRQLGEAWLDPEASMVLMGGAIRSGKTQIAGRLLLEAALTHKATYLVGRNTYRELEDSTKKALLHGDGSLPALIPREVVHQYHASDNKVALLNGSEILFRSMEANNVGKLMGLTLGGIFIDQIEEVPASEEGERIFDALLGRLSDPRAPRKLLAVANPGSTLHWVYRRFVDPLTRDPKARYVHVTLKDNEANLPADYVEAMEATRLTRPHWYRTFVLGEWGAIEHAAYPQFDRTLHVVESLDPPYHWLRFESMDYGLRNPTAWLLYGCDEDGNIVVLDSYYEAGKLPDEHAMEILKRREAWWEALDEGNRRVPHSCFGDPSSIREKLPVRDRWGEPLVLQDEYDGLGVRITPGNSRRQTGYARILTLLEPRQERQFPIWHERAGEPGSPALFICGERCPELVEQLQNAPLATEENDPERLEAVDRRWERQFGHAHAALRYGVLSREAGESRAPTPELSLQAELLRRYEQKLSARSRGLYDLV